MDGLFSHAATDDAQPPAAAEVTAGVSVPVSADDAFEAFTDLIHLWWPLETYSVFGAGSHLGFEEQALVEEPEDGRERVWASIQDWQPPSFFALDFLLEVSPGSPKLLRVDFRAEGSGTAVLVTESGRALASEGPDWLHVLARFARFMGVAEASIRIDP